ncbi:Uma2 family endonuclease [Cnuella takakiae]|nr:Uma2 family endonuclease [Cnuella takakiae]
MSLAEYLQMEETAVEKSEYYKGEVFGMSGGSIAHNTISTNTTALLWNFLRDKPCRVFNSDQKVRIEANSLITYPDVSVLCGEPELWNNRTDMILNPSVIIEVLSPSTAGYDQGDKFKLYRDIPPLKEYILIASTEQMVQRYVKQAPHHWAFSDTRDAEGLFQVETIGFSCPVKELYRNVDFQQQ